jgi:hexulose-6-phosphate isomerase
MGADLGLYSIEWIYEKPYEAQNALTTEQGLNGLKKVIQETGVTVQSICADYYMSEHLIRDGQPVLENWNHLEWLCMQGKKLGVRYLILPFVDQSSLKKEESITALECTLKTFLDDGRNSQIEIHLETDLAPHRFAQVFKNVNHPFLKLNYDIGNSASLGYNPDEEFEVLGDYLGSVHIKDRLFQGGTVKLGTGHADFSKCFTWFAKLNFDKWYVLQAARAEAGHEKQNIEDQINFVTELVKSYGSRA